MQNIINQIQAGELSQVQLLESLNDFNNKTVDEFNEVMDAIEDRNSKLEESSLVLEKQHKAMQVQEENQRKLMFNNNHLTTQLAALTLKVKSNDSLLATLKKEAKTQREQTKRNKAAMIKKDKRIESLEKQLKTIKNNDLAMTSLTTVYSVDSNILQIYPHQLELTVNKVKVKQTALLYTDSMGTFLTMFLDENNEISFSTVVNVNAKISERTKLLIEKNCIRPNDDVIGYAEAWLYRVNVQQKSKIEPHDLICFKG